MKNLDIDIDLIEKYLEGSLSKNEEAAFQERLANDVGFADTFTERKQLQEAFIEASMRSEIKKSIRSAIAKESHRTITNRRVWLTAAAVVLLAAVASVLMYNSSGRMPEKQYAKEQTSPEKGDKEATQKKLNSMEEYSNMDVLVRKESVDDFFPDESTVLKPTDTIIFKWPSSLNERYLTIYNSKGELVRKATIRKKAKEYTLLPGVLKPGVYYWKFMNDSALIRITVSN